MRGLRNVGEKARRFSVPHNTNLVQWDTNSNNSHASTSFPRSPGQRQRCVALISRGAQSGVGHFRAIGRIGYYRTARGRGRSASSI